MTSLSLLSSSNSSWKYRKITRTQQQLNSHHHLLLNNAFLSATFTLTKEKKNNVFKGIIYICTA